MVNEPGAGSVALKKDFEEKIVEHFDSLYNLALRMTQNNQDAEDLVQNSVFSAYRSFDRFTPGTNLKAWLMTILRNTFINDYRKRKKEPGRVPLEVVEDFIPAPEAANLHPEIFHESIEKEFEKLSEESREILTLFYVETFSYKEIADILDCPMGTVMSRLYSARQALKMRLSEIPREKVVVR